MKNPKNNHESIDSIEAPEIRQSNSIASCAKSVVKQFSMRVSNFYHKHPKKLIAGSILSGTLAITGMSQDMRIVNKPYADVVEDFLKNQNRRNGERWVQPEHVEYSNSPISKEKNMPYESAPLMRIQEKNGKTYVIDMGWADDNGNIISLKEMVDQNKTLLLEGLQHQNLEKGENFMTEFWYSVGTTMVNERKFGGTIIQALRMLPDVVHEKRPWWKEMSRSSMRVKRDTLDDYPEEERRAIVYKLARFQIRMASRDRQLIGGSGDEKCHSEFCPIYEIAGYETPEAFEKDFLDREREFIFLDKIKTNHEIGVALGTIILAHARDKTFISDALKKQVNARLIAKGIFANTKIRANETEETTQLYESQDNLIHYMPERIDTVINDYFIDVKQHKKQPYDRSAIFYPTNINRSIHDSKIQMFANFMAMNTGEFDKIIWVDGIAGDDTRKALSYFGQDNIPAYDKEKSMDSNTQKKIEKTAITWATKMSDASKNLRDAMKNNADFSDKDMKFLEKSMSLNIDSMWFTYRTIRHFLIQHSRSDEIIELDQAFMNYVLKNKWTNHEEIFEIFSDYTNKENLIEKFGIKTANNNALFFVKYLAQGLILLNNYNIHAGFSPNNYEPATSTSNEINTAGRGTTNVYTECLNSSKCG